MKKMRRFAAVFCAAALICSMSAVAFGEEVTGAEGNAEVTAEAAATGFDTDADQTAQVENDGKPAQIDMEDGEYAIRVSLEGGSGKAMVTSPALMIVQDGFAYAQIQWSSTYYDYMKIGEDKYLPINDGGNSTFEIPITVFDEPMHVIADTTAMSTAHEVPYVLVFDSTAITDKSATPQNIAKREIMMVMAIIGVCVIVSIVKKQRRKNY